MSVNPYKIVSDFEEAIAEYAGSKYAVATESCTSAILLCLMYRKEQGWWFKDEEIVSMPKFSYPGVANSIVHAGFKIHFSDMKWEGQYELHPLQIWDAALRFKKGMFKPFTGEQLQCLSFHVKKNLPINRGGMILTDNEKAYEWLKLARFDGRRPIPLKEDSISIIGHNAYMQPEQAARGLQILQVIENKELPDLPVESQGYSDLSIQPAYQQFKIYTQ